MSTSQLPAQSNCGDSLHPIKGMLFKGYDIPADFSFNSENDSEVSIAMILRALEKILGKEFSMGRLGNYALEVKGDSTKNEWYIIIRLDNEQRSRDDISDVIIKALEDNPEARIDSAFKNQDKDLDKEWKVLEYFKFRLRMRIENGLIIEDMKKFKLEIMDEGIKVEEMDLKTFSDKLEEIKLSNY